MGTKVVEITVPGLDSKEVWPWGGGRGCHCDGKDKSWNIVMREAATYERVVVPVRRGGSGGCTEVVTSVFYVAMVR